MENLHKIIDLGEKCDTQPAKFDNADTKHELGEAAAWAGWGDCMAEV